jgi:hypothetical protein
MVPGKMTCGAEGASNDELGAGESKRTARGEWEFMKSLLYLVGGIGIAAAYVFVWRQREEGALPVEELAHRLKDAWADHHTVA